MYLGLTSRPDQLSLAIPLWAGPMSTGDDLLAITREENGEVCLTVGSNQDCWHIGRLVKVAGC